MEELKKDADLPKYTYGTYRKNIPAEVRSESPVLSDQKKSANPLIRQKIKQAIAMVESSGHKNRVHDMVTAGVHKDTRAISSYGLMPKHVKEVAEKHKPLKESPIGQKILNSQSVEEIQNITSDQKKDDKLFDHVWDYHKDRVSKFAVSEDHVKPLAILAHNVGINGAKQIYGKDKNIGKVLSHPYVQKVKKYFMESLNKSEQADYLEYELGMIKEALLMKSEEVTTTNHHGHAEINGKFHALKHMEDFNKYNKDPGSSSKYVGETHDGTKVKFDDYDDDPSLKDRIKIDEWHPKGSSLPKQHIVGQI
jgi:hypothetical protein